MLLQSELNWADLKNSSLDEKANNRRNFQNYKGPFTNYVYKRRGVGSQKMSSFVNAHKIENVNGGG